MTAIEIVERIFGEAYVGPPHATDSTGGRFPVREIYVNKYDGMLEEHARAELDRIGWQLVTIYSLDGRHQSMGGTLPNSRPCHCNIFGLAPVHEVTVRPTIVYRADEVRLNEKWLRNGIPASDGNRYVDTVGRIHVCEKLVGEHESAERWVKLFSQNSNVPESEFSILKIHLSCIPQARVHLDFHSQSGLIVDRIDQIPAHALSRVTRP